MSKKTFTLTVLACIAFGQLALAAPVINRDEIKKQIDDNLPEETKAQLESAIYQVAYKVLDTGLTKADQVIAQVQTQLDTMPDSQVSPAGLSYMTGVLEELDAFVSNEQEILAQASSLTDLSNIKDDIVAEIRKVLTDVQAYAVENADQIAAKTEQAIAVLEQQCGADTSQLQADLKELQSLTTTMKENMKSANKDPQAMQEALQEFDPAELSAVSQDLAMELNSLASQCQSSY